VVTVFVQLYREIAGGMSLNLELLSTDQPTPLV